MPDLQAKAPVFFKFGAQEGDGYWNNKLLIYQLRLFNENRGIQISCQLKYFFFLFSLSSGHYAYAEDTFIFCLRRG